jgi:hypothetical protein
MTQRFETRLPAAGCPDLEGELILHMLSSLRKRPTE